MVWPFCVVKVAFHVPARLWSAANSGEFRTANDNVNAAKGAEVRKKAPARKPVAKPASAAPAETPATQPPVAPLDPGA